MAHQFRFFAQYVDEGCWEISGDEAHHLKKVLRLAVGDEVEVIDGRGHVGIGNIASFAGQAVQVSITAHSFSEKLTPTLAIAIGSLKYGDLDELLPMLTELGIDDIHVFGQAGVARDRLSDKIGERWQRILRQATKQAKRPWLPSLHVHKDLSELLNSTSDLHLIVMDPDGDDTMQSLLGSVRGGGVMLIVGGEKGFTHDEIALMGKHRVHRVRLGNFVLRAVTAVCGAAVNLAMYRDGVIAKT